MSARPQILYTCDRCGESEHAEHDMGAPPHKRMSGPQGWLQLRVGDDPSTPPSHICLACRETFYQFMDMGVPK